VWKPNEDFCHIVVDDGMFDDHLPDYVTSAINRLYNQHITGIQKRTLVHTDSTLCQPQKRTIIGLPEETGLPMVDTRLDSKHDNAVKSHETKDELLNSNQQQVMDILTNEQTIVVTLENQCNETSA